MAKAPLRTRYWYNWPLRLAWTLRSAREILASGEYAAQVREREQFYASQGIHSVPAIIINQRHLISGGQPAEVFEQALRQIAAAG